jgi:hypothetical protein
MYKACEVVLGFDKFCREPVFLENDPWLVYLIKRSINISKYRANLTANHPGVISSKLNEAEREDLEQD